MRLLLSSPGSRDVLSCIPRTEKEDSHPAQPLSSAFKEKSWGTKEQQSFNGFKTALRSAEVLIHHESKNINYALRCLTVWRGGGPFTPVAFGWRKASRTVPGREKIFSVWQRSSCNHILIEMFQYVRFGRHLEIHTDDKPLLGILGESKGITNCRHSVRSPGG